MSSLPARRLALLAVATAVPRALLAAALGVWGEPERWEYDVIAANIVAGHGHVYDRLGFTYAAYAPPLWSYTLALLMGVFGGAREMIQIVQGLFCLGAAVTCGSLARRITGDEETGFLAGLMVALQPSLLYYSVVKSDPLPLNALLLSLIVSAGAELVGSPGDRRAAGFGLLLGLGVLARGTPIVALPIVGAALLVRLGSRAVRPLAVAGGAVSLCLAPWLLRNLAEVGSPVITTTSGENFWRGNHEGATGGILNDDGGEITRLTTSNPALSAPIRLALVDATESRRDAVFASEAWLFIRTHPGAAVRLFARKLRTFWWRVDSDARDYSQVASIAYETIYRLELGLALAGMLLLAVFGTGSSHRPDRTAAAVALAVMIAVSLLQCAFYVQGRHRFLIEPLLLMFTATGLTALVRVARAARPPSRPTG